MHEVRRDRIELQLSFASSHRCAPLHDDDLLIQKDVGISSLLAPAETSRCPLSRLVSEAAEGTTADMHLKKI